MAGATVAVTDATFDAEVKNSDVPVGSEKTDKFTAISIEYAF